MTSSGTIYAIPGMSASVLKIEPNHSDRVTALGSLGATSRAKWQGAVLANDLGPYLRYSAIRYFRPED